MKANSNSDKYDEIQNTLQRLGLAVDVKEEDKDADPLAVINDELTRIAEERENIVFDKRFKLSKMPEAAFIRDYYDNPDRKLDRTLLDEILTLSFMNNDRKENIVFWGSAGTGKTWIAELIATEACRRGKRVRWVNFPSMYRELKALKENNGTKLETRLTYYGKFDLLCIDEFLNYQLDDSFLMQELFNRIKLMGRCSLLICSQIDPYDWVKVFSVSGLGESSRGRILERCKNIHLQGADLRISNSK